MAESAELAFTKAHLSNIGLLPVQYSDDYQQPPHNSLKKLPIIPIDLPAPPVRDVDKVATSNEPVELIFKITKPPRTFTVSVLPTDTISTIKKKLASAGAPREDAQRLVWNGKALKDDKLLKEYEVKSGSTVNLMLKPGFKDDTGVPTSASPSPTPMDSVNETRKDKDGDVQMSLDPQGGTSRVGRHGRIPSVILSPSPSPSTKLLPLESLPSPIPLTLDTSNIPSSAETTILDAYQKRISSIEFWERLYGFLRSEFEKEDDAAAAFEAFLLGSKGSLTPSDIAKIRDTIGITGMNGS